MLAELTSNTEVQLPKDLQSRAVVLAGEMAWSAADALRVVRWLSSQQAVVLGVELWREKNGQPQWIATSQGFSESPRTSAHEAVEFINEFESFEANADNLFNLSWSSPPSALIAAQAV